MKALATFSAMLLTAGLVPRRTSDERADARTFEQKLDFRVGHFETSGHPLLKSVLDLAYRYKLPTGIEYVTPQAAADPIDLHFQNETVRGILVSLVQAAPGYQVSFSDGLVDIYAPQARGDSSNLLNKPIRKFAVETQVTELANFELACALARETRASAVCGGSFAGGQLGAQKISVRRENAKVYEILNSIVAQNGKALWTVIVSPEGLAKPHFGGLWHIYPLEEPFESSALEKISGIRPN